MALLVAAERGLPARGRSLPQLLRTSGYATALIGKWHLGYHPEFSPNAHGFDLFFGFKSGYMDFYTHTDGAGRPDLFENDTPAEATGYMTDLITERSIRFIEQHANRPFSIDVSYNAPHWPYQPPGQPSIARDNARHLMPHDPDTGTRADYVAMVAGVDWGVGEILRTLDRLGLAQNTIVIFTNDNDGEWLSDNGPQFHRTWTLWEGGIRVPLLVRWPEVERTLFWRTRAGNQVQRAVRSGEWKLIVDGNHPTVFHMATDIGERRDLSNRRQDVARRLQGLLEAWERDVAGEARTNAPAAAVQ